MSRNLPNCSADSRFSESFNSRANSYSIAANAAGVSKQALAEEEQAGDSLTRRLNVYSLAAVAAGVGMIALVPSAEGEVVATKANIHIDATFSAIPPTFIDLNHDGIPDLQFSMYQRGYGSTFRDNVREVALGGQAVGTSNKSYRGWGYASALRAGAKVGPSAHFDNRQVNLFVRSAGKAMGSKIYSQNFYGKWLGNNPNRFLGVKFFINGAPHFGWVRLTITAGVGKQMSGTITGYAYETIPGKPITAGAISGNSGDSRAQVRSSAGPSLGMLALGSDGLSLWRREEISIP